MYPIHVRSVALVLSLSMGRISPQLHVSFDPLFTTINGCGGNLFLTRYWKVMCECIKGKKLVFVHYEKHDSLSTFIYPSDKGINTIENSP